MMKGSLIYWLWIFLALGCSLCVKGAIDNQDVPEAWLFIAASLGCLIGAVVELPTKPG